MPENLSDRFFETLTSLRHSIAKDPRRNPTEYLAYQISTEIENNKVDVDQLGKLAKDLSDQAFMRRAEHIKNYIGLSSEADLQARLDQLISRSLIDNGSAVSFEQFAKHWEQTSSGAVFTAHPTFGMNRTMRKVMADMASCTDVETRERIEEDLSALPHVADESITLEDEHEDVQSTIERIQHALRWFNKQVLRRAREVWPDQWSTLNPAPLSVASWVGYDLDGRTDIGWQQMIRLRLEEKTTQLERYLDQARALQTQGSDLDCSALGKLVHTLDAALVSAQSHLSKFEGDVEQPEILADAANALTAEQQSGNITSSRPIIEIIDQAITDIAKRDDDLVENLVLLRSEIKTIGLGTAHLHFRINATQLHNGFTHIRELDGETVTSSRMQMSRLNELIERAEAHKVSFRSLMHEGTTALRQFILIAQILKHIDQDSPIRFLIAECESPFTVLVALYFARLFGVEHKVDISPLFETPSAMEKGVRILEQLVDNDRYLAYIKLRGRIAIQTGFSDAGRFIGQITATLAVERLQMKLARMLGHRGMTGIEVLFFNTHGESIGRGAHPTNMSGRLDYVLSPAARCQYVRAGIPLKHETSFQGGDGYLLYGSDALARASVCSILENASTITSATDDARMIEATSDQFYKDTDFSLDFFLHLKTFQEHLFENEDYRSALGCFGTNLLFKTGSRKSIRQHETANAVDRGNPRQIRAIPHNAILQQLGYISHVVSGIGSAVGDEKERFVELCGKSERALHLMEMVAYAKRISSLLTLGSYARLFDSGYWMARAYAGAEPERVPLFRRLSKLLKDDMRHESMMRLVHHLREDAMDLHDVLDQLSLEAGKSPDEHRLQLDLMHAIRLALIEHIFILAVQIPPFSDRHGINHAQVMSLILSMEIPEALDLLRSVYPLEVSEVSSSKFDEEDNYDNVATGGYRSLHENLIEPMAKSFDLARQISVGISHHFLAHG